MQVPKLRFKEFNDEWKEKKLKDISTCFEYGMNLPSKYYDGYNKYIRITDIDEETRNYISNLSVSPDGKLEDKYIVNKNDILFSRTGASVGKTYLYKEKDGRLYFAGYLIRVHINELYNSYFIFLQTLIDRYFKWVTLTSTRTGQPGINSQEYAQYKIYLPSLEEQTKIADFLSLIDRKIELQEKLVENLKLYKKGLLQKVFSNNQGWKSAKLGDFLIPSDKTPVEDTSKYKKLTVKLNLQGLEENTIKRTMLDTRPFYIRHQGEIIIGKQNYFNGSIAIVSEKFDNYICSNAIMSFSISNANTYFIYYQTSQSNYINKRSYMANGTGQKELSEKDFLNFDIKIPSIEEQNRIANLFSNLDKKIDFETKKLQDLKTYKKGLLQKMFI